MKQDLLKQVLKPPRPKDEAFKLEDGCLGKVGKNEKKKKKNNATKEKDKTEQQKKKPICRK